MPAFEFRKGLKRKGEQACQYRQYSCKDYDDQIFAPENQQYHQRVKQDKDQLHRRLQNARHCLPTAFVTTPAVTAYPCIIKWDRVGVRVDYQLPVLVVLVVVWRGPICPTNVAELIATATSHMVATLILLNDSFAPFTLAIVQLLLEKSQFLFLAFALVLPQQTLRAKLRLALVADHHPLEGSANEAFAVFLGTEFHVWVFGGDVELVQFSVGPLHVGGELFEEVGVGVEQSVAVFAGTVHFFEGFDFVDGVVVQARLAKALFVLAVADEQFPFLFLHLSLANLTVHYLPHVLNLAPEHLPQFRLFHVLLSIIFFCLVLQVFLHKARQLGSIFPQGNNCCFYNIFFGFIAIDFRLSLGSPFCLQLHKLQMIKIFYTHPLLRASYREWKGVQASLGKTECCPMKKPLQTNRRIWRTKEGSGEASWGMRPFQNDDWQT